MPDHLPRGDRPTLSTADFSRIEAEFESIMALDPGRRPQAILDALPDRPDLRLELAELMQAHDQLVAAAGGGDEDGADDAVPGMQIGAYRLVEKIGEGGMGEVYRAERADGLFRQQVAVKITRSTIANSELRRRFATERQILASLNHDHIVGLLDGGTTAQGQAFVIMEHVEGEPLTQHCRSHALSLESRLRLFTAVCGAVQYAHQHGVVHRDLKPANILVTAAHVPKVLDFGVAKLLEAHGETSGFTTTGMPGPLTPNYASPEQIRGAAVTTATDVYALGVILYEVVAGARPYETQGLPLDRVIDVVLREEPARPSAVTTASGLPYSRHRLEGDIDAIVMKAMSKEPADRYGSASELAADITRWLDGHPVLARTPSAIYVLSRFARRHTRLVAASGVALTAIVAASGVALWQWREARREQARAEQRFNDVRQLANAVIFKIHNEVKGLPGSTPVRRMIVNEAIGYLEKLGAEAGDDPGLRIEVANALQQVAGILGEVGAANLGDREGAIAQYERALDMVMPLMTADAPYPVVKSVVDSHIRLSELHGAMGRAGKARELIDQAVAHAVAYVARAPGDREGEELQARAYFTLAINAPREEGRQIWLKTYEFYERLLTALPDDANTQRNVALVAKYLGGMIEASEPHEALKYYQRSIELDEQRLSANPDDPRVQFDAAISFSNLAAVSERLGDRDTAARMFDRSLAIRRQRLQADPSDIMARNSLGYLLMRLAIFHHGHNPGESRAMGREAVEVVAPLLARTEDSNARWTMARAWYNVAAASASLGDRAGACAAYRQASSAYQHALTRIETYDRNALASIDAGLAACRNP